MNMEKKQCSCVISSNGRTNHMPGLALPVLFKEIHAAVKPHLSGSCRSVLYEILSYHLGY